MTGGRASLKVWPVIRRAYLLLTLLVASLCVTATVHAREIAGTSVIECTGVIHSDGDADQSQGDADKGIPHHHSSCQGASAFMPIGIGGDGPIRRAALVVPHRPTRAVPLWADDPGLRPPIA